MENREDILLDILFQIAHIIIKHPDSFIKSTDEQINEWILAQLETCGFEIEPTISGFRLKPQKEMVPWQITREIKTV